MSLVSVFLALAVGIVLGAGPLNEGISVGITDQVRQLTSEKNQLRTERDEARAASDARDDWATAVGPAVVANLLEGRTVVVIELPGADDAQVDAATAALRAAGATVSARLSVQPGWVDPAAAASRSQLAAQLRGEVVDPPPADAGTEVLLAAELARAVVTPVVGAVEANAVGSGVLSALSDARLISVDGQLSQRATLALLVAGPAEEEVTDGDPGQAQAAQAEQEAAAGWAALVTQLDQRSTGAVLAGPTESAAQGGQVAAVRSVSQATAVVSTVDDLESPMGQITTVLALAEQLTGAAGQYGTTGSATAVSPPVAGVDR